MRVILYFKTLDDALMKWLQFWGSVWGEKFNFYTFHFRYDTVHITVIDEKHNFLLFCFHSFIETLKPDFKNTRCHPIYSWDHNPKKMILYLWNILEFSISQSSLILISLFHSYYVYLFMVKKIQVIEAWAKKVHQIKGH